MGLTTWKNAPKGKIVKADVSVAKNYLLQNELTDLNQIVTMYLDYAERLDTFLQFNEEDILHDSGKVSAEVAKSFAESEFEKYRPIQDKLFESDFDRLLLAAKKDET